MDKRFVDLTLPLQEGMTTFPRHWHPIVEITQLGRHGIEGRETRKLVMGTHTGTHCDAPSHFVPNGSTVDQIPLSTLIGPAEVLNFSACSVNQKIDVPSFERALGPRKPQRIIMRFDWCQHINKMSYYTDHPFVTEDAARWLVDRGVRLLAMDTPMPDNPTPITEQGEDAPVHKILLGNGIILVEYLCNVRELRREEVQLIVLPLKITGADGSPVRCVALED